MTTIQITKPELETLIEQRLRTGPFANIEDMILDALRSTTPSNRTGADLIAAMKESPFREIDIEPPAGVPMRVRDVTLQVAWLLDTNILPELRRPLPEPRVEAFLLSQDLDSLYIQRR